jgi:hypothetical protein
MYIEFDEAQVETKVLVPEVKTLKQKWVDALRSGKYEQAYCVVRMHDKFCALGVLADVYDPEGWHLDDHRLNVHSAYNKAGFGLSQNDINSIVTVNDGHKWSFDQIADWIEANVKMN